MRVLSMRESDSIAVANLVNRAWESIDNEEASCIMAYMLAPDFKPEFAYKYYNIRSRHLRIQEIFFVAYGGTEESEVKGVLSFSEMDGNRAYLKLLVLDEDHKSPEDAAWLLKSSIEELRRFIKLQSIRVLIATQGVSGEFVGPHVSPIFTGALETAGFHKVLNLQNEGGRDVNFDIYEGYVCVKCWSPAMA
jgi:hypothetical protein